ncbi:MAG TPA: TolC family protein [Longimicrobiales bacterium]
MRMIIAALVAAAVILPAGPLQAQQPLSLRDALQRAQGGAYANRISTAQARATATGELAAMRGILPTVRLEAGYARTTDPIGAFGTTLRQRTIEQADFDPQRLNYPGVASNYTGAIVVEAPLLNGDAHLGRMAAERAGRAARASADWTGANTKVDVIRAYYGAVLTEEKTRTLEAALKAAQAHLRQAELMLKAGLATRSDALLAAVKTGEVETQLLEAQGEQKIAQQSLAVLLGQPAEAKLELPSVLPTAEAVRKVLQQENDAADLELRSDVIAAREGSRAARLDVSRATALYLPRLNAIGRYDWNSASQLYGGDNNWTVGVMATWTPFAGASEVAERRAARARASAAAAGLEGARAQAELDLSKSRIQRQVALSRLEIAERSAQQSTEAHRIVTSKYKGGLATVVELLQAAAGETQSQLSFSYARYAGLVVAAEELRARGADPAIIADLLPLEMAGATHEGR